MGRAARDPTRGDLAKSYRMTQRNAETSALHANRPAKMLPGEAGVWILVLGDMIVFGLFFVTYLAYRAREVDLFDRSQALLNVQFGVINTLLLLTSSWLVVLAVEAVRDGHTRRSRALLRGAFLCGVCFCAIKVVEYVDKYHEGISLVTNDFFMYYFMYTGIHLVHVAIGLGVLLFLIHRTHTAAPQDARIFESGAIFWHMVDLLWIMLFPLLYLVR
jgi:nitric oxide reductase NorE protein